MSGSGGPDHPPLSSVSHLSVVPPVGVVPSGSGAPALPCVALGWPSICLRREAGRSDCEQGLNLVEEAGLGESGEGPGLLASLLLVSAGPCARVGDSDPHWFICRVWKPGAQRAGPQGEGCF